MSFTANMNRFEPVITGVGVVSAIAQGKKAFASALMEGRHGFDVMKRPGRQKQTAFLGAELPPLRLPERFTSRQLRNLSLTSQAALTVLQEAWDDARLGGVEPERIGLIIGGSNFQQREQLLAYEAYAERLAFLRPTYGLAYMDSDLCGICTEHFGIHGPAFTLGGASASGQAAVIQAVEAVRSKQVDVCIALGALADLSYMECQGFRSLGAMGSDRFADEPAAACRPFDRLHDGFIYGEASGAVVVEDAAFAASRQARMYATITGWAIASDGNRNPNPSLEGEVQVIRRALKQAGLPPTAIDYVNPHGTGSVLGDATELNALRECGLAHAPINATKSLTGHGLSAAGTVELIAGLLQMEAKILHPTRNLFEPVDDSFNWVQERAIQYPMTRMLKLSLGFGGINTALCLQKI
ncbi:beta-ketoacyl synthase N-terminal-like domain-containing protein [Paenibacillus sp. Mc5Re-14]|uniref:beta-ketoacyl synthase N-terminal-like domain-containing protein n=1 Tax=Paenibacillus sp. Mc5Re-14 TaxID=1030529 RepID=UPI000A4DDC07|nr:beta-ketoacyl synthase N-terminal-like domain-containing protein [Paenibacillus sp. Mc5Re-14]